MTEFRREALIWACAEIQNILENDDLLAEAGVLLKQKADECNMDDETREFMNDVYNDIICEIAEFAYTKYLDSLNDEG